MKPTIPSIKGTRDFYPSEMAVRNWLYENARAVSEAFGYQEYDGPFLESLELYAAKSGEELVKEQSFVFPDRGGDLITLRPELTPTLARMVAQRQQALVYPLRWWSWGPFWRYEKPQKGRTREFFQWNIDLIGVNSPEADAELVAIAAAFLHRVGLTPDRVAILINNRRLMDGEFEALDIPLELRGRVLQWIDRRDKLPSADWHAYAQEIGLQMEQIDGLCTMLGNENLWQKSDEMQRFFAAVRALGAGEYVRFAPHIIRGLAYYTGTVFEVFERAGDFRAILGGGHYDNLVGDVGGDPLTGMGFAMGDLVVSLVLQKYGCLPQNLGTVPAQVLVTIFDPASFSASLALSAELRQAGLKVICYPEAAKMSRQIKFADRCAVKFAVILGPDELARRQAAVKDLRSGEQVIVARDELVATLRRLLQAG